MKTAYLKHSFSCLPDVNYEIDIDDDRRLVTVSSSHFDSHLFGDLVVRVIPDLCGVVAYRSDDAGWTPPPADYRLRVRISGFEFHATVVKLSAALGPGRVAVRLDAAETTAP